MESVLAYFYISYSEIPPTLSGEGNISPNSPGVTNFWMRPLFNLRIDPNQLSSGSDTVSSLSLPPGNITSEASNKPK